MKNINFFGFIIIKISIFFSKECTPIADIFKNDPLVAALFQNNSECKNELECKGSNLNKALKLKHAHKKIYKCI
jgi:hypothetical protein